VRFSKISKIIIIEQAPGQKIHNSEISFKDKSSKKLIKWLGLNK
jgi:uracil-DNA glycosylase